MEYTRRSNGKHSKGIYHERQNGNNILSLGLDLSRLNNQSVKVWTKYRNALQCFNSEIPVKLTYSCAAYRLSSIVRM